MKRFALFLLFCLLLVDLSTQIPKYEGCDRQVLKGKDVKDCVRVKCLNEKDYRIEPCKTIVCPEGKQIGYHNGDRTEEYPACCSYPICKQ